MQRLFVAILPPAVIIDRLVDLQWGLARARWSGPDQLHLTLRFIGPVRDDEVPPLVRALAEVTAASPAFSLCLRGTGHFPPRGRARSLWAGVDGSESDLAALHILRQRVDAAFQGVGLSPDRRKFAPHVTLARLPELPQARVAEWLAGRGLFKTPDFPVSELVLMRSILRAEGSEYQVVQRFALASPSLGDIG